MKALTLAAVLTIGCTGTQGSMIAIQTSDSGWTRYTDTVSASFFEIQQGFRAIAFTSRDAAAQCVTNGWKLPDVAQWSMIASVGNSGMDPVFYQDEWSTSGESLGIYNHEHAAFGAIDVVPQDRYVVFRCTR